MTAVRLGLLKGFELTQDGRAVPLPLTAQRVLAFLALRRRPVPRLFVAGVLWPDTDECMARASLRSALWRLQRRCPAAVETSGQHLALGPPVSVDVHDVTALVRSGAGTQYGGQALSLLCETLSGELLPGWYEDWVLVERESLRQHSLHLLEQTCERLTATGRYAEAIEAGLRAVAMEPLRESAQLALLQAHLAEGNRCEALRQYELYRDLLRESLDVEPSPRIRGFMASMREPTTME
jgi:DNA-binding SARP family transcriptional activator